LAVSHLLRFATLRFHWYLVPHNSQNTAFDTCELNKQTCVLVRWHLQISGLWYRRRCETAKKLERARSELFKTTTSVENGCLATKLGRIESIRTLCNLRFYIAVSRTKLVERALKGPFAGVLQIQCSLTWRANAKLEIKKVKVRIDKPSLS
jgi:hypothetical protein